MPNIIVRTELEHIATVELNRPPSNFLDEELIRSLVRVLRDLDEDASIRCTVLCSRGKVFCAGREFSDKAEYGASSNELYKSVEELFQIEKPIIAAVQGAAVGGGLGLALFADFRVATPEARFSANFSRLGFHHGFGLTVTLPSLVGSQKALEMLLTGCRIKGEEALRIGLCDRLAPIGRVRLEAQEFAADIAKSAPLAVLAIRKTMRADLAPRVAVALSHEGEQQAILKRTNDFAEGVQSVSDRRVGNFEGN